jgi:hypothetical protein
MVLSNDNVTEGAMTNDDKMTIDERRKYLRIMQKRYAQASHQNRSLLLDEMEHVTALDRKTLLRAMRADLERRPRRKERGRQYGAEVDDALRIIAESLDYIAAERLTPNLVWVATHLAQHGELQVSPELLAQLQHINVSTVRRILQRLGQDQPRLPRQKGPPTRAALREIPMKRIPWDEPLPGHFETDLVHHCGPSTTGDYVHTLQMIDVTTGWSERVAVLGRSYLVLEDAFRHILKRLPFRVLEIHPDNGAEFFSAHLLRFWKDAIQDLELSRSHPFRKNDNRFVEQKNHTLVGAYLGHDRLDSVAQTNALNTLYEKLWLFYNFFQPVMRLQEKTFLQVEGQTTQVKRRFDAACTPFDRLCATKILSPEREQHLRDLRDQTNPRRLRQEIHALRDRIFSLPNAIPGVSEHVFDTLTEPLSSQEGDGALR